MDGAIVTLAESKANCPHCERHIPFDEMEVKFDKQEKNTIRMLCKCRRFIGVTTDYRGDFVAFNLKS